MRQHKRMKKDVDVDVDVDAVESQNMLVPSAPPSSSSSSPPTEAAGPPPTPRGPALPPRPAWLAAPVSKDFYTKINLKSNVL